MSPHLCRSCRRLNPSVAAYCHFDGTPLVSGTQMARAVGSEPFPAPFVLPSGQACRSFVELAHGCRQNWDEACRLLKEGGYRLFLMRLGRADLVQAAERAARHPDLNVGLDEFLAGLPGCKPAPPQLEINAAELDLGALVTGQDRYCTITIQNAGERLLHGRVSSVNCLWLGVSSLQLNEKRFQATGGEKVAIPLYIRGKQLRAGPQSQVGEVAIDSNGGRRSIRLRFRVPVTPFPEGGLKGVQTPRELALKAMMAQQETARLLENGSIARWYQCNGWTYPITGPAATGLALVQQFFEALGLTTPTRVELRTNAVTLKAPAGGATRACVVLSTAEKRPIYAHAQANQPWLKIGPTEYRGNQAFIPLSIASVPACTGQTLQAEVKVQANGQQRFTVPIRLHVGPGGATDVKQSGLTGFDLPPLPNAPLPSLPAAAGRKPERVPTLLEGALPSLPPLPDASVPGPGLEAIPVAEARVDFPGSRSRRRMAFVCLLLSILLLISSAALAAWKYWFAVRKNTSPPPTAQQSAVRCAPQWEMCMRLPRARSMTCPT